MSNSIAFMVVAIVLIVSITGLLRARMGIRKDRYGNELPLHESGEADRLREEMRALKERVAVLERIATERNHSLEQEIDRLRDR